MVVTLVTTGDRDLLFTLMVLLLLLLGDGETEVLIVVVLVHGILALNGFPANGLRL